MIHTINQQFWLTPEQIAQTPSAQKKRLALSVISTGNTVIGQSMTRRLARTLLKRYSAQVLGKNISRFIPLLGQVTSAGLSFITLYKIGTEHIEHCCQSVEATFPSVSRKRLKPHV